MKFVILIALPGDEALADDKLRAVFGKERISMFVMNKHLSRHLS